MRRRQRPDKLTNFNDINNEVAEAIFHSVAVVDRVAHRMEEKWGVNRLPKLVSPETAAKFGSAKAKFDKAIDDNDADEVSKRAGVMERAWIALDKEAVDRRQRPLEVDAWVWRDDDGQPHAFVKDTAEALKYGKENADVRVYTMAEIARIAAVFNDKCKNIGNEIKAVFPGSEITKVKTRGLADDEIPF